MIPPAGTPLSASWKVPFREYYADSFGGMLIGCWRCFWATLRHRLAGSPRTPRSRTGAPMGKPEVTWEPLGNRDGYKATIDGVDVIVTGRELFAAQHGCKLEDVRAIEVDGIMNREIRRIPWEPNELAVHGTMALLRRKLEEKGLYHG